MKPKIPKPRPTPPAPERTDQETQALADEQTRRYGPGGDQAGRLSTILSGGMISKLGGGQ